MDLKEAKKTLLDFIRCAEEEFGKVKYTSTSMNVDDGDIEAISTILQELEHLQKENEKYKNRNKILESCKYIDSIEIIRAKREECERWRGKIREKIEELKQDFLEYTEEFQGKCDNTDEYYFYDTQNMQNKINL